MILFFKAATIVFAITLSVYSSAADVTVTVLDSSGQPVPNLALSLDGTNQATKGTKPQMQVMDQVNTQFSPFVLLVQKGAKVSFPNSDSVKHHVYSFSDAKSFELKLYRDRKPSPLPFQKAGEVTLGCNVHDWMIGYIYVVDTPYFGKTNKEGQLTINLPPDSYTLLLHSPLLSGADTNKHVNFIINKAELTQQLEIRLAQPMLPNLSEFEDGDEFDAY
jgi:plastocyanin